MHMGIQIASGRRVGILRREASELVLVCGPMGWIAAWDVQSTVDEVDTSAQSAPFGLGLANNMLGLPILVVAWVRMVMTHLLLFKELTPNIRPQTALRYPGRGEVSGGCPLAVVTPRVRRNVDEVAEIEGRCVDRTWVSTR